MKLYPILEISVDSLRTDKSRGRNAENKVQINSLNKAINELERPTTPSRDPVKDLVLAKNKNQGDF